MRGPWMRAALRQILPAHHDMVDAGMPSDKVIEILARIGLVAHQEAPLSEAEILNEHRVAGQSAVSRRLTTSSRQNQTSDFGCSQRQT